MRAAAGGEAETGRVGHLSHRSAAARHTYIVVRGIIAAHIVAAQRCLREQLFYLNVNLC